MRWRVLIILLALSATSTAQTKEGCVPGCTCGTEGTYKILTCNKLPNKPLPKSTEPEKIKIETTPPTIYPNTFEYIKDRNVVELDLCQAGIKRMTPASLGRLKTLQIIRLSQNEITTIELTTFTQNPALREIYLDGNHISTLQQGCFSKLPNLEKLYIQCNKLQQIPQLPPTLQVIDISSNEVQSVDANFQVTNQLEKIDLCDNPLVKIPTTCFKQNNQLQSLCLGDQASEIQRGTADTLQNLNNITLCAKDSPYQPLSEVNVEELRQMQGIKHLTINFYTLTTLEFLREKPNLLTLTLEHDKLEDVTEDDHKAAFYDKKSLVKLSLANSPGLAQLTLRDPQLFYHLSGLQELNLRECGLVLLVIQLTPGRKLTLDIAKNQLHCDCYAAIMEQDNLDLVDKAGLTCSEEMTIYHPNNGTCKQAKSGQNLGNMGQAIHDDKDIEEEMREEQREEDERRKDDERRKENEQREEEEQGGEEGEGKPPGFEGDEGNQPTEAESEYVDHTEVQQGNPMKPNEEEEFPQGNPMKPNEEEEFPQGNPMKPNEEEEFPQGNPMNPNEEEEEFPQGNEPNEEENSEDKTTALTQNTAEIEDFTEVMGQEGLDEKPNTTTTTITFALVGIIVALAVIAIIVFTVLYCFFKRRGHQNIEAHSAASLKGMDKSYSSVDHLLKKK